MNHHLKKKEVISLISESLRKCPYLLECVALFGSSVKKNSYRDIDLLVILSNKEDTEGLKHWIKESIEPLLTVRLDIKCYAFESFLDLIGNYSPLVLSIAVEIEYVIYNPQVAQELASLEGYLFEKGIDISEQYSWKVNQETLFKITNEENKNIRGFLISHLDWIENHNKEIQELLRVLTPLDEPYTRIACFKQVISLISSEEYRKQLNISIDESINFATQILSNRKNFDWNKYEDYSKEDLCLELVYVVKELPQSMLSSVERLLRGLIQDFNHHVRISMIEFIHNKVLSIDSRLGFHLLAVAFNYEHKHWINIDIYSTYFVQNSVINKKQLKLLLQGYGQRKNNWESTRIQGLLKALNDHLDEPQANISWLIKFFVSSTDLYDQFKKITEVNELYLSKVLDNLVKETLKIISFKILQKDKINTDELYNFFTQLHIAVSNELIKELIDTARQLNYTIHLSAETYSNSVRLIEVLKKIQSSISIASERLRIMLDYVLKNIISFLEQLIKDAKI